MLDHAVMLWFWMLVIKFGLLVFSATFNNISIYRGGQFYWWRKREYPMKTTDLSENFYLIMLY